MLRHKIKIIISALLFQITIFYTSTINAEIKFTRESWGISRIYGKIDDRKFEFRVTNVPFSELAKERKTLKKWRGLDSYDPPRFAISKITFQIENTIINFPVSAYHDLGIPILPYGMKIVKKGQKILLKLKGGDGAGSYTSIFIINNAKLIERQIMEFTPNGEHNVTETIKFNR